MDNRVIKQTVRREMSKHDKLFTVILKSCQILLVKCAKSRRTIRTSDTSACKLKKIFTLFIVRDFVYIGQLSSFGAFFQCMLTRLMFCVCQFLIHNNKEAVCLLLIAFFAHCISYELWCNISTAKFKRSIASKRRARFAAKFALDKPVELYKAVIVWIRRADKQQRNCDHVDFCSVALSVSRRPELDMDWIHSRIGLDNIGSGGMTVIPFLY